MRDGGFTLDKVIKLLTHKFSSFLKQVGTECLNCLDTYGVEIGEHISGDGEEELSYKLY